MLNEKYIIFIVGEEKIRINTEISMNNLKKMKNEFLSLNKVNPFKNKEQAKEGFIYFIKSKLK